MPCFTLWKHVHWKPRTLSPAAADLVLVRSMRIFSRGETEFSCSFCGKTPDKVEKLIAGEDVVHLRLLHDHLQEHSRQRVWCCARAGGGHPAAPEVTA
ncbi:MAG: hypothetical protein DME88_03550 [Verrucomicrobia bacterium]|nr:MAG: hypothetical protein DME88_03550 [Verrucomicrobiota bacterium]